MGAAIGAAARSCGHEVVWALEGRSGETAQRAVDAGLVDVGTVDELARTSEIVLSVCPPHAALDVAHAVAPFGGVYVDANAVSPATVREVAGLFERVVDGGIIGGPSAPRLHLAGTDAARVAALFDGSSVDAHVLDGEIGVASALKMVYAAWTKGTAALLLAIRDLARAEAVDEALVAEWRDSLPDLEDRLARAERSAAAKGWRWVGEMEQIAATFAANGLPPGFHEAAAEVYRRSPARTVA